MQWYMYLLVQVGVSGRHTVSGLRPPVHSASPSFAFIYYFTVFSAVTHFACSCTSYLNAPSIRKQAQLALGLMRVSWLIKIQRGGKQLILRGNW